MTATVSSFYCRTGKHELCTGHRIGRNFKRLCLCSCHWRTLSRDDEGPDVA